MRKPIMMTSCTTIKEIKSTGETQPVTFDTSGHWTCFCPDNKRDVAEDISRCMLLILSFISYYKTIKYWPNCDLLKLNY